MLTCRGNARVIKFKKNSKGDQSYIRLILKEKNNSYDAYIKEPLASKLKKEDILDADIVYNGKILFKSGAMYVIIGSIIVIDSFYK